MPQQLREALLAAGLEQSIPISTETESPSSVHQFYLTLTRFEFPIFVKVRASKRQEGLKFLSSRGLNSLAEIEELTRDEAQEQLDQKFNKWFTESLQEGQLIYWSFLK